MSIKAHPNEPYRVVQAIAKFLPKTFTDVKQISPNMLESSCIDIRCYTDIEELNKFNIFTHGFQFCKLEKGSSLTNAIHKCAETCIKQTFDRDKEVFEKDKTELSSQLLQYLSSWGLKNNIPGVPVIIDKTYRNSDAGNPSNHPFHFIHVDFAKEETTNLSSTVAERMCRPGVEKVFGKMSDDKYLSIEHFFQLNAWILLSKQSHNTLAVLDSTSVPDISQKMRSYSNSGIKGYTLDPNPEQIWVAKENFSVDDDVILFFPTAKTFHTAAVIEGVPEGPRRSIEFRIDFCSPPDQTLQGKVCL